MTAVKEVKIIRRFGPPGNQWVLTDDYMDLTRGQTPTLIIQTRTIPIRVATPSCAMVVIDMQQFFLSPRLGRKCHLNLVLNVAQAVEFARQQGMNVFWVNWGLTEEEVFEGGLPASVERSFFF